MCTRASVSDLAFRTDKATHVLHHSDDRQLNLLAEPDLLSHVLQRHLLKREKRKQRERQKEKGKAREEGERGYHGRKERRAGYKDSSGKSEGERIKLFSILSQMLLWFP